MNPNKLKILLHEMDMLKTNFTNCRAFFPHMTKKLIGEKNWKTAPFYFNKGFPINFSSKQPLTEKYIQTNNEIGHWLNQNFIVRLYAMLESHQIVSEEIKIDQKLKGWKELDLVRRLRRIFAHSSGRYDPVDTA